nr:activating signal cointegrator 1 complex subunit 2 homolog [Procambarus clarkii]
MEKREKYNGGDSDSNGLSPSFTPSHPTPQHSNKEASPQQQDNKEASPQQQDNKEASPQQQDNKEASPQQQDNKEASPQQQDNKEASPQQQDNKEASPQQQDNKEASPQQQDNKEASPQQQDNKEASPQQQDNRERRHSNKEASPQQQDNKEATPQHSNKDPSNTVTGCYTYHRRSGRGCRNHDPALLGVTDATCGTCSLHSSSLTIFPTYSLLHCHHLNYTPSVSFAAFPTPSSPSLPK